ncbi:MAG: hypothetical protein A3I01_01970 [Betaproteobacteria bacterium RIFCSPLOWO2_02_FULL_65_24]|nr:MAG: hypothetical protein A3I01_01970 [Betaproteobacteria bacterium RIFCSPLOWO2_02_FULL_65_24]
MDVNTARIERLVRELLIEIGEDPDREGLVKPPGRSSSRWSATRPCERTSDDDIDGGMMMTVGQGA